MWVNRLMTIILRFSVTLLIKLIINCIKRTALRRPFYLIICSFAVAKISLKRKVGNSVGFVFEDITELLRPYLRQISAARF